MSESSTQVISEAAAIDQGWEKVRFYHSATMSHARLTAAGMAMTGRELLNIKSKLGFAGRGRPKINSATVAELNWEEWLAKEIPELPRRTADNRIELFDKVKTRFKKLGDAKAIALLEASDLTPSQQLDLEKLVKGFCDGQTAKDIFLEANILKGSKKLKGGDNPKKGDDEKEDIPLDVVIKTLMAEPLRGVTTMRCHGDYEMCLFNMDEFSDDPDVPTLQAMEAEAQAILADVKRVREEKQKAAAKKAKKKAAKKAPKEIK